MEISNLTLITITPEQHAKTCNYWYLIRQAGISFTAFTTRSALLNWVKLRNLTLTAELPEEGVHSVQEINGSYNTESHMGTHQFNALPAIYESKGLSNGSYTLFKFTEEDGVITEHHLNPNCKDRPIYDYHQTRALFA